MLTRSPAATDEAYAARRKVRRGIYPVQRMGVLGRLWAIALVCMASAMPTWAATPVELVVATTDDTLRSDLTRASQTLEAAGRETTDGRDLFAAALTDYRRLTEALYANGYYGGVVRISVNGREAATIDPLNPPDHVSALRISVDPGRPFTFGRFTIAPRPASDEDIPPLEPGTRARSTQVRATTQATLAAWRSVGHAKARTTRQRIVADHRTATLSGEIDIAPGPVVTFGRLILPNPSAVRERRIRKIAGLPSGARFSPEALDRVATRLRRTGAFASVSIEEADQLGPGNTLDIPITLVDAKPRRFGFGAELSNFEGLRLSAFWLHRNLFGGAERFRIEGEVDNIGGQTSGTDYMLGARLTIPATLGPDTNYWLMAEIERLDEPDFTSREARLGFGALRYFGDTLEVEAGLEYLAARTTDAQGDRRFDLLNFPVRATWDRRDDLLNPTSGTYLRAEIMPYAGLKGSTSGLRSTLDARAYRGFGTEDRFVLAGRVQLGSVAGSGLTDTYPDYLFYSGGGGTVRGQPYRALDIDLGGGNATGGRSFVGLSAEFRAAINDRFGAVAFADAGYIGRDSFYTGSGTWHSGAGVGLRYNTPLGPIRFDVGVPVSGDTGEGVQLYLGIGQSF